MHTTAIPHCVSPAAVHGSAPRTTAPHIGRASEAKVRPITHSTTSDFAARGDCNQAAAPIASRARRRAIVRASPVFVLQLDAETERNAVHEIEVRGDRGRGVNPFVREAS